MSDELKERPMDFETERPSQSEIDAAVAEITARLKAADAKEDRISLLEAEVDRLNILQNETAKYRDIYMKASTHYRDENRRLRDAIGILTARNPDKWGHWLYDRVEAQNRALALLQGDKPR
jgi:hypothetical protein